MPSISDHKQRASHNDQLFRKLKSDAPYGDWAVTTAFYTALHEVQAFLIGKGRYPASHSARRGDLRHWADLADPYEMLEDHSKRSRYQCHSPSPLEVGSCDVLLRMIRDEIAKIG